LELFSRSAPAWFIAARQFVRRSPGSWPSVSARSSRRRCASPAGLGRLRFFVLLGLLRRSDGDSQDRLRDATGDAGFHFLEEAVRLALVRDERILLAVAAEIDAFAQLFHRGEVL